MAIKEGPFMRVFINKQIAASNVNKDIRDRTYIRDVPCGLTSRHSGTWIEEQRDAGFTTTIFYMESLEARAGFSLGDGGSYYTDISETFDFFEYGRGPHFEVKPVGDITASYAGSTIIDPLAFNGSPEYVENDWIVTSDVTINIVAWPLNPPTCVVGYDRLTVNLTPPYPPFQGTYRTTYKKGGPSVIKSISLESLSGGLIGFEWLDDYSNHVFRVEGYLVERTLYSDKRAGVLLQDLGEPAP